MAKKKQQIIGIPRGLLYYKYHVLWEEFFRGIGRKVVVSPATNKKIMKTGANWSVDESCLAMKIYLGHVHAIKDSVDYIFSPRFHSLHRDERACTKLLAVTDIVRNTFDDVEVLSFTVNADKRYRHAYGLLKVGMQLCNNPIKVFTSYINAHKKQKLSKRKKLSKQIENIKKTGKSKPTLLLVAHSYVNHDAFLGLPIVQTLEKEGMHVVFADIIDSHEAREKSANISTDLYWTYNKELLGAIEVYKKHIDGMIFVMAFPCGPDSLVINLCQNKIEGIPMAVITLDELQADAGLKTRLESFVDIIKFRIRHKQKKKKS
ncbi:acyl-CoA dehydratase activase-related protein [Patescibacteria group bacterium]